MKEKKALTTILLTLLILGGCASSTASNSSAKNMTDFKPIGEFHLYRGRHFLTILVVSMFQGNSWNNVGI